MTKNRVNRSGGFLPPGFVGEQPKEATAATPYG
jgi:hypothetical protein